MEGKSYVTLRFLQASNPWLFATGYLIDMQACGCSQLGLLKVSAKFRHWIAIALAVVTMVIALLAFADFSGSPVAQAKSKWAMVSMSLMMAAICLNQYLDMREVSRK